ncbi:MAG: isoprenylcysteine carboxylmethyltransferase family protein [bacterium]
MLLKDKLIAIGHTFFRYRTYQFLIYVAVILLGWRHFYHLKGHLGYELFCYCVAFSGIIVRSLTCGFVSIGTSGRNTRQQEAVELNTTGMYSICRNPLYIGNFLVFLGIVLLTENWLGVIIASALFWIFYTPIILTEEDFLVGKFKEEYLKFASETNCIIPSFKNFKKPAKEFSLWMVLMREHDTLLSTTLSFLGVEILREYATRGHLYLSKFWIGTLIVVFVIFFILKYFKKYRYMIANFLNKSKKA